MRYSIHSALAVFIMLAGCKKTVISSKPVSNTITINRKSYPTIIIGSQTWTTVNYDGPGGVADSSRDEATYGKFYSVTELSSIQLPSGWRIPVQADFQKLMTLQGPSTTMIDGTLGLDSTASSHLRSVSNWEFNSDDRSGFNAEPAGLFYIPTSLFEYEGTADFLSTTPDGGANGGNVVLVIVAGQLPVGSDIGAYLSGYTTTIYRFSLRFVKDN